MTYYQYETVTNPPCERCEGMSCDMCEQLTSLEAQIGDLHCRLEDMYLRHCRIRQNRNHLHSPLIHQFPPEIVTTIFSLAFPPRNTHSCHFNSCEKELSPLVLAQVCHTWRELAFSIPSLWCNLSINVENPNYPLLNHQIAYSGTMPFSIDLFTSGSRDSEEPQIIIKDAISFAIKQLYRTSMLCFELDDPFIRIFNSASVLVGPKALPLLEELHVHYNLDGDSDGALQLKLSLDPPCPRRVILFKLSCSQIYLDWTNVSSFELDCSMVRGGFPEILASKDLKRLSLSFDRHFPSDQIPVVNQSIQYLTLKKFGAAEFMLKLGTLSSLQVLRIDVDELGSLGPTIYDFLRRSRCPLQVLSIASVRCSDKDTAQLLIILENVDILQGLSLQLMSPDYAKFAVLLAERLLLRDRRFLPLLQALYLRTMFVPPIELFLDAISANGPSTLPPLQDLRLELNTATFDTGAVRHGENVPDDHTISRNDIVRILKMRAAGKTISILSVEWGLTYKFINLVDHWKEVYGLGREE